MLIFWIKNQFHASRNTVESGRLNYGSWLHVSSTKNNHMALNVHRSLWRFAVIMLWYTNCYGFRASCFSTCFVQEQLLASSCCLFPAQRLNEEMLSREVMFQSRNSNNKRIQWGNIKFTGQKSCNQLVLIYCWLFQLVNNTAYANYGELKGMGMHLMDRRIAYCFAECLIVMVSLQWLHE
jgi:hypothetical protein